MLIHCLTSYARAWGKPRMFWGSTHVEVARHALTLWREEIGPRGPDWHKDNWQAIHLVETPKTSTILLCRVLNGAQWKLGYKLTRAWNRPALWDAMLEDKLTPLLVTRATFTGDNKRPEHNSARVIKAARMFQGAPMDEPDDTE